MAKTTNHLCLWLSKSLLNFAGTAHQLYRQKLCSLSLHRCCLSKLETNMLHALDCSYNLLLYFKQTVIDYLQQAILQLTDNDLIPFRLLDFMLHSNSMVLPESPARVNTDL